MSVTTLANVKNRIPVDLTDAELQIMIDRIESRLTQIYGAPGATARTDTFYDAGNGYVKLPRNFVSIEAVYNGTTVDTEVDDPLEATDYRATGATIRRLPYGYSWLDTIVVEWTPTDITDEWIECVIDIVRLRLARTAHRAERTAEWSYSGAQWEEDEREIMARLGSAVFA